MKYYGAIYKGEKNSKMVNKTYSMYLFANACIKHVWKNTRHCQH